MSSIIRPDAPIPTPIDPIQVKIYDQGYRGVTVDSSLTPLANIIQFTEGSVWTVQYYSQVLNKDDEPQPQQNARGAPYQQYIKIERLELKVITPLNPSHDPVSGSMIGEGTAYIPLGVIPNKGDCFYADIGQGREGLLTVTAVERKTYFAQTVYVINYEITQYIDHSVSESRQDIEAKTVKTVVYVKDHSYLGVNPLMLSDDFHARIRMQELYTELCRYYFSDFYSYGYATLLIPDQTATSYDPFLTDELLKWVDVDEEPIISKVNRPRVTTGFGRIPDTVWSAISRADYRTLRNAVHRTGLVSNRYFRTHPDLGGFYYFGVEYCVYPDERRVDVDRSYQVDCEPTAPTGLVKGQMRFEELQRLDPVDTLPGLEYDPPIKLPDIVPVSTSGYYVFSEGFYSGKNELASNLERLIYQHLKGETVEVGMLVNIASQAMKWGNLERFYYIPALLALLKTAIRKN